MNIDHRMKSGRGLCRSYLEKIETIFPLQSTKDAGFKNKITHTKYAKNTQKFAYTTFVIISMLTISTHFKLLVHVHKYKETRVELREETHQTRISHLNSSFSFKLKLSIR